MIFNYAGTCQAPRAGQPVGMAAVICRPIGARNMNRYLFALAGGEDRRLRGGPGRGGQGRGGDG